jgi:hypothetical protein
MGFDIDAVRRLLGIWKPKLSYISRHVVEKAIHDEGVEKYFLTDDWYMAPRIGDVGYIFSKNTMRFLRYRKEEYDCDDFARTASATLHILYGNIAVGEAAVVLAGGTAHMVNFVVAPDGELVYVEPQTNKIIQKDFKPYFMII